MNTCIENRSENNFNQNNANIVYYSYLYSLYRLVEYIE